MLALALKETESMTKWITAERSGPVLWVLEDLLALGTKRLNSLKGGVEIFYMKVEVHRSPMALELASVIGLGRRLGTSRLFK